MLYILMYKACCCGFCPHHSLAKIMLQLGEFTPEAPSAFLQLRLDLPALMSYSAVAESTLHNTSSARCETCGIQQWPWLVPDGSKQNSCFMDCYSPKLDNRFGPIPTLVYGFVWKWESHTLRPFQIFRDSLAGTMVISHWFWQNWPTSTEWFLEGILRV